MSHVTYLSTHRLARSFVTLRVILGDHLRARKKNSTNCRALAHDVHHDTVLIMSSLRSRDDTRVGTSPHTALSPGKTGCFCSIHSYPRPDRVHPHPRSIPSAHQLITQRPQAATSCDRAPCRTCDGPHVDVSRLTSIISKRRLSLENTLFSRCVAHTKVTRAELASRPANRAAIS